MSLRRKTIVLVLATIAVLGLTVLIMSSRILKSSFASLESEFMQRNADRVQDALSADLSAIQTYATDWGNWDDAFQYMSDCNHEFVHTNLAPTTLPGLRLSLLALFDTLGRPLQAHQYDLESDSALKPDPAILRLFGDGSRLLRHHDTTGLTGIVMPEGRPLLVAVRPILRTDKTGPTRGTLVMGRFLDSAEVASLAATTHLAIRLRAPDDRGLPALTDRGPAAVVPLSRDWVAAYTPVFDLSGRRAFVFEVSQMRSIYHHGQVATTLVHLAVLLTCLVLGALTVFLLETLVLGRLSRLTRDVVALGECRNGDCRRVRVNGRDELATLAAEINRSVVALEEANIVLAEKNRELAESTRQRQELLDIAMQHDFGTPMTVVQGFAELLRDGVLGPVPDKQRKAIESIYTNLKSLDTMRSQMLEVSGFDKGSIALERADVDPSRLMAECVSELSDLSRERNLDLQVSVPALRLSCDPARVRQVVRTYLALFVKYAAQGMRILINGAAEGQQVHFSFSAESAAEVAGDSQDRFGSWGGLGLALADAIVAAHHGKAWIERVAGQDSRIHFTLPLAAQG
jgi:sensor domain CHASE-containing protein